MTEDDVKQIESLIKGWEEETTNDARINGLVARTAAILTRFGDTPPPVRQALNTIKSPEGNVFGNSVMVVVTYLRDLARGEHVT